MSRSRAKSTIFGMNARSTHWVVGLCGNENTTHRRGQRLPVAAFRFSKKSSSGTETHVADPGARDDRPPDVDRIRRARHHRRIARAEQHPHQVREPLLGADRGARLRLGVEGDTELAAYRSVTAPRSLGSPLLVEYRWLLGFSTASRSFSTATSGDGMSGLPNPRSTTSSPARRASLLRAR